MLGRPTIIDVSPGRRRVAEDLVLDTLGRVRSFAAEPSGPSQRFDSDGWMLRSDAIDAYHRHVDEQAIRSLGQRWRPPAALMDLWHQRRDALPNGAGGFPRDFEFMRTTVFEEKRPPLSAMELFPADTSVPLGARTHAAMRALGSGEAQVFRGGSEMPRARVTFAEESFGVAYVVCAVDQQFFDALTTDWAGLQLYQRELRLAYRLVDERVNRIEWDGDVGLQIAGVLSYPSLAKVVVSTPFTDASDPEEVAAAMADFVNTPMIQSRGTFFPNRLVVSTKIWAHISSRPTTLAMNQFIADLFLNSMRGRISKIDVAQELDGIGPNGEDGMLAFRDDLETVGRVQIQAATALPVFQASPIEQTTLVFAATGGVVMPDVGNCILGYVEVAS